MRLVVLAVSILIGISGSAAQAQDKFPSKPITILLGYPPGGSTDTTARALAPVLERILGQPVVVMNRPGAAAKIELVLGNQLREAALTAAIASTSSRNLGCASCGT